MRNYDVIIANLGSQQVRSYYHMLVCYVLVLLLEIGNSLFHSVLKYQNGGLILSMGSGFGAQLKRIDKPDNSSLASLKSQILSIEDDDSCVCCSGFAYKHCCGIWHKQKAGDVLSSADTKSIVRARYTAYALGLADFLIETTHTSHKVRQD